MYGTSVHYSGWLHFRCSSNGGNSYKKKGRATQEHLETNQLLYPPLRHPPPILLLHLPHPTLLLLSSSRPRPPPLSPLSNPLNSPLFVSLVWNGRLFRPIHSNEHLHSCHHSLTAVPMRWCITTARQHRRRNLSRSRTYAHIRMAIANLEATKLPCHRPRTLCCDLNVTHEK